MQTTRMLLNGERLTLTVPGASELPAATAISVLLLDGLELEINSGTADDLDFYLSLSGTTLTDRVQLSGGPALRYGRYGGDPAQGVAFAIAVGEHEVYGFTLPGMDVEQLAGYLGAVQFTASPDGPALTVSGTAERGVAWSLTRTHTVAQMVTLSDDGYLLDVRRARSDREPMGTDGLEVAGGRLTRSSVQERHAYAILESEAFVTYGIPGDSDRLDLVASSMSGVTTELS